ncbi:MAG: hypothetical protein AB1762_12365 [Gemmatimonadota bacterium]
MPVHWEWRDSILLVTTIGAYGNDELSRAFVEIRADASFATGAPLVLDARESKAALTKDDIEWRVGGLADTLKDEGFGLHIALVVTGREPHRYGLARMVQVLTEPKGFDCQVFTDLDEALRWAEQQKPNE